ncbi:MAG TPA: glycosyl hydrolase [Asticcacaulis sp.]|nr:glycosyl hydrolase [Asticcacaulis sp.]
MTRKILLAAAAIAALFTAPAFAAQPWQDQTAAAVQAAWGNPPAEYGPEPYFQLATNMDALKAELDKVKALGFQGVTVQYNLPRAGEPKMDYLSPEYFNYFKQFVAEVKKRDMRIWIVDDAGYPSGFAGGKFTSDAQDLRMQALTVAQKWPVAGGATLDQDAPPETVAVTALSADGKTVQVPYKNGKIHWVAPAGSDWTVNLVTHIFKTSPTRSDTNPTRAKDETQSLEDYMDPAATARYIAFTHDAYRAAVGDEFGKTILGFRGDEPDFSIPGLPWTPKFFDRFQAEKGYDIRPYLASFMQGRDAPRTPESARAWADYNEVFSLMFAEGFFKPLGDWTAKNGLGYQVHLNHEEMQLQLVHSEGDFLRDMKPLQVPGVDAIWHQVWTDTVSDFPRFASSAAHLYGRQHAFTESFAAFRPQPDLTIARYVVNEQMVRGINMIEMMNVGAGQNGFRSPMYMQDPAFPDLAVYTRRLSYLMSQGRPAAHVAVLVPRAPFYMGDKAADDMFVSTERLLSEHQVDFDLINEDAVTTDMKAVKGGFETQSGNTYRTVVIPMADLLTTKAINKLKAFTQGGGQVLFLGRFPTQITDNAYKNARPATAADFAWATLQPARLDATPIPPAQPPAAAPGPLNPPAVLVAAMQKAVGRDDLSLATADTGVRYTHRVLKDASVFLLFNEQNAAVNNSVTLRATGHTVEVWDPQTGTVTPVSGVTVSGDSLTLPLALDPYATKVFVVR